MFQVIFLQAGAGSMNDLISPIMIGAMILVFWLFIMRPQAKKQKDQRKFIDSLEKGKQIVTTSGILGKITKIEDDIITIEVGNKVYLRITKGAISKEMTDTVYAAA